VGGYYRRIAQRPCRKAGGGRNGGWYDSYSSSSFVLVLEFLALFEDEDEYEDEYEQAAYRAFR
jgi:hypothetical protein